MQMRGDLNLDTKLWLSAGARARRAGTFLKKCLFESEERKAATVLFRALEAAKSSLPRAFAMFCNYKPFSSGRSARSVMQEWTMQRSWTPNRSSRSWREQTLLRVLAVFIGKTRLIDNLYVEPKSSDSDELVFHF